MPRKRGPPFKEQATSKLLWTNEFEESLRIKPVFIEMILEAEPERTMQFDKSHQLWPAPQSSCHFSHNSDILLDSRTSMTSRNARSNEVYTHLCKQLVNAICSPKSREEVPI